MKKIMKLTEKQLEDFNEPNKRIDIMRDVLDIDVYGKATRVGGTLVLAKNAQKLDVFKDNFKGKDYHYIIMDVVDSELAYAISIC